MICVQMAAIWCGGRCAIGAIGSSMSCRCSGTVQIASAKAFSGRLSDQAASDRGSKLGSAAWLDGCMARWAPGEWKQAVGSRAVVSFGLARSTRVGRPRRHDLGLQCARCRLRGGCWVPRGLLASKGMGRSLRQVGARSGRSIPLRGQRFV